MNDILIISRNGNELKLFCNSYMQGKDCLYYYSDIEPEKIEAVLLEDPEITLENLELATYYFSSSMDMSDSVSIPIVAEKPEDLEAIYKDYISCDDEDEKEEKAQAVENLIARLELCANYYEDDLDIRLIKSNVIRLEINSEELFDNGLLVSLEIEKFDLDKDKWSIYSIVRSCSPNTVLSLEDSGLFRLSLISNDMLLRRFTVFTEEGYSDKNFEAVLNRKNLAEKESSYYFLPPGYRYSDDREKEIVLNLNYFDKRPAITARPIIGLEDTRIRCQVGDSFGFFKLEKLYLCGIEEDQIYASDAKPRLIPVMSSDMKFDIREYRFNREPYYFYFADENGTRLSGVTYLDLSREKQDNNNYNQIYQYIAEGNYVIRLGRVIQFFYPYAWPRIRKIMDSYLAHPDIEYTDMTDYVMSRACAELSLKEFNLLLIIFYTEFCRQKYYLDKNIGFRPKQRYERLNRTHFIEKGNYICEVKQMAIGGKISYSYYDGREAGVYFRTDKAQYTLFRCISLDDYTVNDFNMYYLDSDKNVLTKYIDETIEVCDGR